MNRKPFPSETQERFIVRFPDGMRDKIADAAKANNRSMNAEIVHRIQATLDSDEAAFISGFENETELRAAQRLKATVGSGAQQVAEAMGHAKGTPELEQVVQALSEEMRAMLQKQTQELIDGFVRAGEMQKNNPEAFAKLAAIKPPTNLKKPKT